MRERHVYDTSEIAHLWVAHNLDGNPLTEARNSGRSNFYFDGPTIYSYGSHFPCGVFIERKGQKAVLLNTDGYSVTTSGHKSMTAGALHNREIPAFHVTLHDSARTDARNLSAWRKDYAAQVGRELLKAKRSRQNQEYNLQTAAETYREALAFCKFFGLRPIAAQDSLLSDAVNAKAIAAKQEKAEAKKRDAEAQERLVKWLAGDSMYSPHYKDPQGFCRLRIAGDEVQTTLGATVPLDHARRAYGIISKLKTTGALPWESNGHTIPVGNYKLERIDADGNLKAGCHSIPWSEVERIGKQLA